MRREDKRRMPQRLKVKLPPGYHVEAVPDGYNLYASYASEGGRFTRLVSGFAACSTIQEIEAIANTHRTTHITI